MPDIVKEKLLKAFADVGMKILWKWETESMEGKPDNILLRKWLPQQDVLGKMIQCLKIMCHGNITLYFTICCRTSKL